MLDSAADVTTQRANSGMRLNGRHCRLRGAFKSSASTAGQCGASRFICANTEGEEICIEFGDTVRADDIEDDALLSFSQYHGQIEVDFPRLVLSLNGTTFPLRLQQGSYVLDARPARRWDERPPSVKLTDVNDVGSQAALRALNMTRQAAVNADAHRLAQQRQRQQEQQSARAARTARRAARQDKRGVKKVAGPEPSLPRRALDTRASACASARVRCVRLGAEATAVEGGALVGRRRRTAVARPC